ncbi:MAG: hypothetical protein ACLTJ8_07720 [Veillonella atypica]
MDRLITEREANGLYTKRTDFCRRVDSKVVNKRLLESLIGLRCHGRILRKIVINYLHMYEKCTGRRAKRNLSPWAL